MNFVKNNFLFFLLIALPSFSALYLSFTYSEAYSSFYTNYFIYAYSSIVVISSLFITFLSSLFSRYSKRFVVSISSFLNFLFIKQHLFISPFNLVLFYSFLICLEWLFLGGFSFDVSVYNNSLGSLPIGFKALQFFVFILAVMRCYYSAYKYNEKIFIYLIVALSILSLLTLKRNSLFIALLYLLFLFTSRFDIIYLLKRFKTFKLKKSFLITCFCSTLAIVSFLYLFGLLGFLRIGLGIETNPVIYALSVISFYIQMPITNFASYVASASDCSVNFFDQFLPNRIASLGDSSCTLDAFVYEGTSYGFWGIIYASSFLNKLLYLVSTSFVISCFRFSHSSWILRPLTFYYVAIFFQSNLFLRIPFSLTALIASCIIIIVYRSSLPASY